MQFGREVSTLVEMTNKRFSTLIKVGADKQLKDSINHFQRV